MIKRAPVGVDVARALYNAHNPCVGWSDIYLPDVWLLSHQRVPMPPMPL
jgi:hypothetical protein